MERYFAGTTILGWQLFFSYNLEDSILLSYSFDSWDAYFQSNSSFVYR